MGWRKGRDLKHGLTQRAMRGKPIIDQPMERTALIQRTNSMFYFCSFFADADAL
jgi:hypothetical protein